MFPTLSFGDQEFTPEEMSARSAKVAGAMAAAGLKEGDTIALMLRNEPALMDVMLAARQLGVYFTPLNWHFKSEEAGYIVRDCGAKALFTHTDLFRQISDGIPNDVSVFALRLHPFTIASYNIQEPATRIPDGTVDWAALVAAAKPLATSATIPRGMIAYTSGTTGRPKGVRRFPPSPEDAQVYAELLARMFQRGLGLLPDARCLISAPLYHSAPCVTSLMIAQFGLWLRLEPKFDAESTLSAIERLRITHPYLVPTMYVRLLRLPEDVRSKYDLSSVKFVGSTGAPCAPDVKRAMIDWWGDVINETYAASETGYLTAISSVEARLPGASAAEFRDVCDRDRHEFRFLAPGPLRRRIPVPVWRIAQRDPDAAFLVLFGWSAAVQIHRQDRQADLQTRTEARGQRSALMAPIIGGCLAHSFVYGRAIWRFRLPDMTPTRSRRSPQVGRLLILCSPVSKQSDSHANACSAPEFANLRVCESQKSQSYRIKFVPIAAGATRSIPLGTFQTRRTIRRLPSPHGRH